MNDEKRTVPSARAEKLEDLSEDELRHEIATFARREVGFVIEARGEEYEVVRAYGRTLQDASASLCIRFERALRLELARCSLLSEEDLRRFANLSLLAGEIGAVASIHDITTGLVQLGDQGASLPPDIKSRFVSSLAGLSHGPDAATALLQVRSLHWLSAADPVTFASALVTAIPDRWAEWLDSMWTQTDRMNDPNRKQDVQSFMYDVSFDLVADTLPNLRVPLFERVRRILLEEVGWAVIMEPHLDPGYYIEQIDTGKRISIELSERHLVKASLTSGQSEHGEDLQRRKFMSKHNSDKGLTHGDGFRGVPPHPARDDSHSNPATSPK